MSATPANDVRHPRRGIATAKVQHFFELSKRIATFLYFQFSSHSFGVTV